MGVDDGLQVFVSWQAFALALATVGVTGIAKRALDAWDPTLRLSRWVAKVLVPALPLVIGAALGAVSPIRPEAVQRIVDAAGGLRGVVAAATWGLVAGGVLGAWLYDRARDFIEHGRRDY